MGRWPSSNSDRCPKCIHRHFIDPSQCDATVRVNVFAPLNVYFVSHGVIGITVRSTVHVFCSVLIVVL